MDEEEIQNQLLVLVQLFNKKIEIPKQVDKPDTSIKEMLNYLRVGIKYLWMDLEATRREVEFLKKQK